MLRPAAVELRGPLELVVYEGETVEFNCKAKGDPMPESMKWTVAGDDIVGLDVIDTHDNNGIVDQVSLSL